MEGSDYRFANFIQGIFGQGQGQVMCCYGGVSMTWETLIVSLYEVALGSLYSNTVCVDSVKCLAVWHAAFAFVLTFVVTRPLGLEERV